MRANGEPQRPWSLKGEIVKVPSKQDEILIDFSPKGGPKNLLGKLTPEGGILFPDGNTWSKLERETPRTRREKVPKATRS